MPISDYSHHNEEAERIWWEEEGRHDPYEDPDPDRHEADYGAADAYAEEVAEMSQESIVKMLSDADYRKRWPKAVPILEFELQARGGISSEFVY